MSTIEAVKSYWDRNPCNIRHSKTEIGTAEYFDQVEFRKYKVEPHIRRFADFQAWRGKTVLEIGFGIGTDAINFARHGAIYTGIELSDVSYGIAKKRFEVFGLSGNLIIGNAENLDQLVKGDFDLIYSFGVLHHTPHPEVVVGHARRLLAFNGEFRFMVYASNSWKRIMIEAGIDQPESREGCPIARMYSESEIQELLSGFRSVSISQTHIFPYDIERYIAHEYVLAPWFREMPKPMIEALESRLGWHMLVKAK